MKRIKFLMTVLLASLACTLFADLPLEGDQPEAKTTVITSTEPAKAVNTTFVERVVTVTDPSTVTYPVCNTCENKIPPGRHYILMQDGRQFCSQVCFEKALPKCEVCGKSFMKGYTKDNHFICSATCLEATWPKCQAPGCGIRCKVWKVMPENNEVYCLTCWTYPKCHSCLRPDRYAKDMKDGRFLCRPCMKTAVSDPIKAQKLVAEVRDQLITKLNVPVETKGVMLYLDDLKSMRKIARYPGQEPGTLIRKDVVKEVVTEEKAADGSINRVTAPKASSSFEIHILDNLSTPRFMEVAAHELAVLWLENNYPGIGDMAIKEGFGEWVAAQLNELYGRPEMNIRMEVNKDPYYGGGYRRVKQQIDQKGFEEFKKHLEALSNPDRP